MLVDEALFWLIKIIKNHHYANFETVSLLERAEQENLNDYLVTGATSC